jgi:hypothetical protein
MPGERDVEDVDSSGADVGKAGDRGDEVDRGEVA